MLSPPNKVEDDSNPLIGPGVAARRPSGSANSTRGCASTGAPLPAPLLLSRSHSSIELLPYLFLPGCAPKLSVRPGGDTVGGKALTASNGTSTSATAVMSRNGERSAQRVQRIAKVLMLCLLPSARRSASLFSSPLYIACGMKSGCTNVAPSTTVVLLVDCTFASLPTTRGFEERGRRPIIANTTNDER